MVVTVTLSKKQLEKLDEYRQIRKQQTGKMPFRDSAIRELMDKSLEGIEPEKPFNVQLEEIMDRLNAMEARIK